MRLPWQKVKTPDPTIEETKDTTKRLEEAVAKLEFLTEKLEDRLGVTDEEEADSDERVRSGRGTARNYRTDNGTNPTAASMGRSGAPPFSGASGS